MKEVIQRAKDKLINEMAGSTLIKKETAKTVDNGTLKITEADVQLALARYYDWYRNLLFPNAYCCGSEMDLAVVTPARYLWEIEIKTSLSDWKADCKKDKWHRPYYISKRKWIKRFYYCVPLELLEKGAVPEFVPESAGLIGFYVGSLKRIVFKIQREAFNNKVESLPDEMVRSLLLHSYRKFWRGRFRENGFTEYAIGQFIDPSN